MELLLNLVWLLLVVPAYWLWRRGIASHRSSSRQCLFALGCALVLLFPVISATDDLHAMRAEMEEPSSGKRAVRPAGERHSAWINRVQGAAGFVVSPFVLRVPEVPEPHPPSSTYLCVTHASIWHVGRAPPLSILG
jgi:hypothetical protein